MTPLDEFAKAAMSPLMRHWVDIRDECDTAYTNGDFAEVCYDFAEAMMKERAKRMSTVCVANNPNPEWKNKENPE